MSLQERGNGGVPEQELISMVTIFFRAVIETLREVQKTSPERKCFRMIGGVLVERNVKEVLPALEGNLAGVSLVLLLS